MAVASQESGYDVASLAERSTGGFTEGFDTADLKDAKALLDELSN